MNHILYQLVGGNFESENQKFVNVSDYISGMTDKFAINIHKKYFDLYSF